MALPDDEIQEINKRLKAKSEPWQYHFYFLSPEDYTKFFQRIKGAIFAMIRRT